MTLEAEKKLVTENLMGWDVKEDTHTGIRIGVLPCLGIFKKDGTPIYLLHVWNPQEERKWWDEIWEKMDKDLWWKWYCNKKELLGFVDVGLEDLYVEQIRAIDTASPETCWEALIKTLEGK